MSIACAVLMCHAPIVVPQIAGDRGPSCVRTTRAMEQTARALVEHEPQVVVLVSPHTPRDPRRWGICHEDNLRGSFARFGHRELALSVRGAPEAARTLSDCAEAQALGTHAVSGLELDHGALVPLYFLHEAGYSGQVLLIALPFPGADSEVRFGAAIRAAAQRRGERWAVLASGDMSHRLTPDAPAGYDPDGPEFDRRFVELLRRGDLKSAINLPSELVERAGEDVVQSTAVAAGAVAFASDGMHTLSYEGPFGVGYCEALLFSSRSQARANVIDLRSPAGTRASTTLRSPAEPRPSTNEPPAELLAIAHAAIDAQLRGASFEPPTLPAAWQAPRAVFVTLRSPDGELRGCVGRTEPLARTLAAEVADCAIAAATRDHRMVPVAKSELSTLDIEVSVLSPPEPIEGPEQLDPQRYGVVVRHGSRRGVLLPAIETIDTVEQQLAIALRKAGVDPSADYRLERFTVDKVARSRS
jgi:MEMO1 family protein